MKLTRTFTLELGERKGGAKTFPAVLSTEMPVRRRDFEHGEFMEVLSHKAGAIDLSRAPLPLLESHDQRTLPVGIVDNIRIVDRKLRGEVTFGTSERAKEIAADVEAGIIRNLSVAYSIEKATEKTEGREKTITATRWTPHEVSAVAVGADGGAGFGRSSSNERNRDMDEDDERDEDDHDDEESANVETRSASEERKRILGIQRAARALRTPAELVERHIARGTSLEAFRVEALAAHDGAAEHLPFMPAASGAGMYGRSAGDPGTEFRVAAVDAVLLRAGIKVEKPHPAAHDIDASVAGLARVCVSRAGKTVSGSRSEALIRSAMGTSDFPLILADAMHKATRRGYEDEPSSHRLWVRAVPVSDFRSQHRPILGSAPELEEVHEHGEYRQGPLDEDSTSYRVAKYGKIVSLSWEALKNDDLGAFMRVQPAMGQAARRKEADIVYSLFTENAGAGPTMQDGTALFHSSHGNVATGAALDSTLLGDGRALLRKQTALGGGYLSLVPRFLIAPAELETDAEVLLAAATRMISDTVDAERPQWLGNLVLVVEPRLADGAVYLAADSAQIDTVELGVLDEHVGGPTVEEESEFVRDERRWKVRHVVGAKALDWRGMAKLTISP